MSDTLVIGRIAVRCLKDGTLAFGFDSPLDRKVLPGEL